MLEEPHEESLVKIYHLGLYKVPYYWKVKNSGWTSGQNSHEHKFERNINTLNPIKNVWYIKYYSLNSKEHINKCASNFYFYHPLGCPNTNCGPLPRWQTQSFSLIIAFDCSLFDSKVTANKWSLDRTEDSLGCKPIPFWS